MITQIESRSGGRNAISIPAVLKGQDETTQLWEAEATIYNYSKNGIGFFLNKDFKVGRLLSVSIQTPFDLNGDNQFPPNSQFWGIVQHCNELSTDNPNGKYHLGLALVGENPPVGYYKNSLQSYRLCGIQENGFWKIAEAGRDFVVRKYPRFNTVIEVFLGQLDNHNNIFKGEKVTTENLSIGGLAVYSSLNLTVGESVKIVNANYEFSALSIVRSVDMANNKKAKIGLEFASAKFPIAKLKEHFSENQKGELQTV